MQEHQIDVVGVQLAQRLLDGGGGPLVGHVGHPDLGGDEDVLPRYAAGAHGGTHALLVAVGLGGVDEPVADLERLGHAAFGLFGRGLEDAVAEHGHLDAIVESLAEHGGVLPVV